MADGYARAGGEGDFGTAFVVPGPGLLNAASGLSTAYSASSPVLMIAGQIPKGSIGKNIGLLHEVNDQLDAIAPVTKWRRRILEIADIPAAVREAVRQLKTGRPRPVEIELSPETMEDEGEAELLPASEFPGAAPSPDIDRTAEMRRRQEPRDLRGRRCPHLGRKPARRDRGIPGRRHRVPEGKGAVVTRAAWHSVRRSGTSLRCMPTCTPPTSSSWEAASRW
jgi:thiamine pyrophosphate-dependent acetolactate synthase large subunit-like protein